MGYFMTAAHIWDGVGNNLHWIDEHDRKRRPQLTTGKLPQVRVDFLEMMPDCQRGAQIWKRIPKQSGNLITAVYRCKLKVCNLQIGWVRIKIFKSYTLACNLTAILTFASVNPLMTNWLKKILFLFFSFVPYVSFHFISFHIIFLFLQICHWKERILRRLKLVRDVVKTQPTNQYGLKFMNLSLP